MPSLEFDQIINANEPFGSDPEYQTPRHLRKEIKMVETFKDVFKHAEEAFEIAESYTRSVAGLKSQNIRLIEYQIPYLKQAEEALRKVKEYEEAIGKSVKRIREYKRTARRIRRHGYRLLNKAERLEKKEKRSPSILYKNSAGEWLDIGLLVDKNLEDESTRTSNSVWNDKEGENDGKQ